MDTCAAARTVIIEILLKFILYSFKTLSIVGLPLLDILLDAKFPEKLLRNGWKIGKPEHSWAGRLRFEQPLFNC